jgi:subtilisin family serine protease
MKSKRTLVALATLCLAVSAFAADPQRYLVATKRPFHAGAMQALRHSVNGEVEPRNVVPFETFSGFAATLSEAEVATLRTSREVRWIEPVLERHAFARDPFHQVVPYGIDIIFARQAQAGIAAGTVNVVVVDTGVDYKHPELKDIWMGGHNFIGNNEDPFDDGGHGTHVAGTIAAANNGIGVLGVAPNVRLWSYKMLNSGGSGTSEGVIASIDWVTQQKLTRGGNWVANYSLGANGESPGEREAFLHATDAGVLVVAASGNSSTAGSPAPVAYPASYPGVVAVGAINSRRELASFSSQGPEVALAAPGVGILSTLPVGWEEISYVVAGNSVLPATNLLGARQGIVTGEFVYCGLGAVDDFPASVKGRIALIKRGVDTFGDKTRRAKEAGAIAVAIFNHDDSTNSWRLIDSVEDQNYEWPVTVRLSKESGAALLEKGSGVITVAYTTDDYGEKSGTSMACPHVVGAAALLWTLAPNATAQQIVSALTATATDLGAPGRDPEYGFGALNVNAAARLIAPGAFGGITTGRPVGKRGH